MPEDTQMQEIVLETINTNIRQPVQQMEEMAHQYKEKIKALNSLEKLVQSNKLDFLRKLPITKGLVAFHNKAFYTLLYILNKLVFMILVGEAVQRAYQVPESSFEGAVICLNLQQFVKILLNTTFLLFSKGRSFHPRVFVLQICLSVALVVLFSGWYFYLTGAITGQSATLCAMLYLLVQLLRFTGVEVPTPFFMQSSIYGLSEAISFLLITGKVTGGLEFLSWNWAFLLYKVEFGVYIAFIVCLIILAAIIYIIFIKKLPAVRRYGILAVVICLLLVCWLTAYTIMFYLLYRNLMVILETEALTEHRDSLVIHIKFYSAVIYMEVFASLNMIVILSDYFFLRNLVLKNVEKYMKIELSVDSIIENVKETVKKLAKSYLARKMVKPETLEMADKLYHAVFRPRHICKPKDKIEIELKEKAHSKAHSKKKKAKKSAPGKRGHKPAHHDQSSDLQTLPESKRKSPSGDDDSFEDLEAPPRRLFCPDCGEELEPDDELIEDYVDRAKKGLNTNIAKAQREVATRIERVRHDLGRRIDRTNVYVADKVVRAQQIRSALQTQHFN